MISDGIRQARKVSGLTQEDLAKILGINRATVSKYESGAITPSIGQLCNIAAALKTNVGKIMGTEFTFQRLMDISNSQALQLDANMQSYRISLLAIYDDLNEDGQKKAVERLEELAEIPKYQRKEASLPPPNESKV